MNEETKCEKCNGTGWVFLREFKDIIHKEFSDFKSLLYVECECRKKAS